MDDTLSIDNQHSFPYYQKLDVPPCNLYFYNSNTILIQLNRAHQ